MKKITLILAAFVTINTFAQSDKPFLPESMRQEVIANLQSADETIKSIGAYKLINHYRDTTNEIRQILLDSAFKQNKENAFSFIKALFAGGYPNSAALFHRYIDTVEYLQKASPNYPDLHYKYEANFYLMYLGDYSKFELVFEIIEANFSKPPYGIARNLGYILRGLPAQKERVVTHYKRIIRESIKKVTSLDTYSIMSDLIEMNDPELEVLCKFVVRNDPERSSNAIECLEYLQDNQPYDFESFLKEVLLNETGDYLRQDIVGFLFERFSYPKNFKFLQDYVKTQNYQELNEVIYRDSIWAFPKLLKTRKRQLDETFTAKNYIDSLASFNRQCYELGWVPGQEIFDDFNSRILAIKAELENDDEDAASINLANFINKVKEIRDSGGMTYEAYHFLYWYPKFIFLRKLLDEPSVLSVPR